ncbi:DUF433 domain-containing protein [Archaeoglobus sp.]
MEEFKWVEINPEICSGKPVVKGTRIPVKIILELFANGWTIEDIEEEYDLTEEQIKDSIRFASQMLEKVRLS